ncbi:c-type cytochrome biogenesis protein CcmI [Devosia sp. 1566]|uniref:c-type cytochrome biogenesis protein CcmI n=1 Tax=Devosia sp. 1566 TaxID=2499144 RepID=UPI0013E2FE47|nr:c-type cytochrome biogenesis protein CcmI [Devosia sp. 1566]
MLFWFIATAVTAIACAALFYAGAGHRVNATRPQFAAADSHFATVLARIEADEASGLLGAAEAAGARAELAREVLRAENEARRPAAGRGELTRTPLLLGLGAIAAISLGTYGFLGSPNLPSQPLAGRAAPVAEPVDINAAVARIEAQLAQRPDDLRGWTVIAPAYVDLGRLEDAERAYRRVLELGGATPDVQTKLAEVLILQADGAGSAESMQLLRAAAASDPNHVLSRLYLAAELTRTAKYEEAVAAWREALALSQGGEGWLPAAQQGLAVALNGGQAPAEPAQSEMIGQMVSGLAARLNADGGSPEEWTQLVRAYLVLEDREAAQSAYDAAVAAYPQAFDRGQLDTIALDAGLTTPGATR